MAHVEVPPDQLSPDALRGLVEEFITREGTDYGQDFSLAQKVDHVMAQLRGGDVVVLFDTDSETCNLATRQELARHQT